MVYSALGCNHTLEHRTRPLDSTTHAPSVRGREGLWHRDYRWARSLRAPQPEVVVPVRGRVPVAVRRAHVERCSTRRHAGRPGTAWPSPVEHGLGTGVLRKAIALNMLRRKP